MKKVILVHCIICLIFAQLFSQDTTTITLKPKTEIQKLDLKTGAILRKQYFDVYKTNWIGDKRLDFKIVNIKDAASKISLWGLYVEISYSNKWGSGSYTVYIDNDEMSSIIRFIDFIEKNDSAFQDTYTEYLYNFKEFQIYTYNNTNYKPKWNTTSPSSNKSVEGDGKSEQKGTSQNKRKEKTETVLAPNLEGVSNNQVRWYYGIRVEYFADKAATIIDLSTLIEVREALKKKMILISN